MRSQTIVLLAGFALLAAACQDQSILGQDGPNGGRLVFPNESPTSPHPKAAFGPACATGASQLCLGLKYVVYKDSTGRAVVSGDEAISNVGQINSVYAQCGIVFQIDEYLPVTPRDYGLNYNTSSLSELDPIRSALSSSESLLVVTTGTWMGSLGAGAANAWTTLPGEGHYGAVLEEPVGTYPNLIGHELGHYLNLDHVSDTSNLMNPVIYTSSKGLSAQQCGEMRATATNFWARMIR